MEKEGTFEVLYMNIYIGWLLQQQNHVFYPFAYRWNVWKTIPNENWMIVFRDRWIMENKVWCDLQATALKHHNKIEVCEKDLDGFVRLKNEEPSLCCYVEDALCEILQKDVW